MNLRSALLASALPLCLVPSLASAVDVLHNGALGVPANRIVGLWSARGLVAPCGMPAVNPINAIVVFHAGGTLSTSDTHPDVGVPNLHGIPGLNTRGPGYGRWSYNPQTNRYHVVFRFNWFVDGFYHGYQQIDRQITLNASGTELSGAINAARYLANGTKHMDFCGQETSTRI